ncbi:MAG: BNR-4 repeat-containing protein [Armatimonadetes bacterium]|nr:BNR-4 repeat-containing protein [Armatimonadota bacterium]
MERILLALCLVGLVLSSVAAQDASVRKEDGYRGIWYANQASNDEYVWKYSGGLGTYTANHVPIAVYVPEVNKTFFVYGGSKPIDQTNRLLEMVSYYDHNTGTVPKPTLIREKGTDDAHHNPALTIDKDGYLWVFCASHGGKDGFIYKSKSPYSIDGFELVMQREFSYPQIWYFDDFGFVFIFTKYTRGRELYVSTSKDGITWTPDQKYAGFDGHYQSSWKWGNKVGTSFNWHPPVGGLNARTNLYYMETRDFGATWADAAGKKLDIPLSDHVNGALVRDYQKEGWLVYINDVNYDREGNPIIFYNLSKGYESGPAFGERVMMTAHWTGVDWDYSEVTKTDHNYDMGSLYVEADGSWRVIAPTVGPQPWSTGGEVGMWKSSDQGRTWRKIRNLTPNSEMNHHYVRRVLDAHPDFYAFWADGHAFKLSESSLYFSNRSGTAVRVLPEKMTRDNQKPRLRKR